MTRNMDIWKWCKAQLVTAPQLNCRVVQWGGDKRSKTDSLLIGNQ